MSKDDGCGQPKDRRPGDWFSQFENEEGQMESTTSASLKHVLHSAAALGPEHRMPLEYRARVQEAGNDNFPFSSHDNRDVICNAAEYFDLGMGLRKLDPEKRKQTSHNFFQWNRAPDRSSKEGFVTVYQSSFVAGQAPGKEEPCCRRYPKHHTHSQCGSQNQCSCHSQCGSQNQCSSHSQCSCHSQCSSQNQCSCRSQCSTPSQYSTQNQCSSPCQCSTPSQCSSPCQCSSQNQCSDNPAPEVSQPPKQS